MGKDEKNSDVSVDNTAEEEVDVVDLNDLDKAVEDTNNDNEDNAEVEIYKQQIKDLEDKLKTSQEEKEKYLNLAKQTMADFENYKKRNKKAVSDAYTTSMSDTIRELLPVLDNLERAVTNSTNAEEESIKKGVEMVLKQFKDILTKLEIEEIEAEGEEFDPEFHNAVMQVEAEDEEQKNKVVEVLQKGYKCKDKIVRYCMVKVAV